MVHFRFPIRQIPVALQEFATDMETIVDQVFNHGDVKGEKSEGTETRSAFRPAVDIYESAQQFDLYMDLPGVSSDAVKIEMHDERLIVSGTRAAVSTGDETSAHRVECMYGQFTRSIQLPKQLDADRIGAHFDNGVLHVVLPKQAKPSPRTIAIKTNS